MAKGFKHGSGGTDALNFKVVGGPGQPGNPKENTIWVNTETDISGWVLSPEEPVGPSGGLVWIYTGSSGVVNFNAIKKNGIQVYPIYAKQYISGAWVTKHLEVYQKGEWHKATITFFKNGTIMGGYVTVGYVNIGTDTANVTVKDMVSSYVIHGPISLHGYSQITMTYNYVSGNSSDQLYPTVFVARNKTISHGTDAIVYSRNNFATGNNQKINLDIIGETDLDNVYVYYGIDNTANVYDREIAITEVVCR